MRTVATPRRREKRRLRVELVDDALDELDAIIRQAAADVQTAIALDERGYACGEALADAAETLRTAIRAVDGVRHAAAGVTRHRVTS